MSAIAKRTWRLKSVRGSVWKKADSAPGKQVDRLRTSPIEKSVLVKSVYYPVDRNRMKRTPEVQVCSSP